MARAPATRRIAAALGLAFVFVFALAAGLQRFLAYSPVLAEKGESLLARSKFRGVIERFLFLPQAAGDRREQGLDRERILPPPPALTAPSAVLLDVESGKLLFARKAFERRPPGGLTKIVTALVVFDWAHAGSGGAGTPGPAGDGPAVLGLRASGANREGPGDLEKAGSGPQPTRPSRLAEAVRIGRAAAGAPGYSLRLEEGEELSAGDLLAYMYFLPGSDAAVALAEHVAGSTAGFVARMNLSAVAHGAEQSAFKNPSGADEPGHVSTAYDLALLTRAALEIPEFSRLASARRAALLWRDRHREVRNVNSFLWRYPGALGVKSAYSPAGGYSIAALAARGGVRLLAVVLGAPTARERWLDVASLLDYGFAHFRELKRSPLLEKERYRVSAGDTLSSLARRFDVPISALRLFNDLSDPDQLKAGSELWIPR